MYDAYQGILKNNIKISSACSTLEQFWRLRGKCSHFMRHIWAASV